MRIIVGIFFPQQGFLWEAAEKFKALIVFVEHRYYGKSLPPKTLSHSDSNVSIIQASILYKVTIF